MAAYVKIAGAIALLESTVNAATDQWAFALTNTTPSGTTFTAGTSDLVTGGGYTQGGTNVTTTSATESAGTFALKLPVPATWTASAAGFTFRYVTLVDKTTNTQVGYWDNGSSIVMNGTNADTFVFTPDTTNGVFTIA
jgi:hypothetical protein